MFSVSCPGLLGLPRNVTLSRAPWTSSMCWLFSPTTSTYLCLQVGTKMIGKRLILISQKTSPSCQLISRGRARRWRWRRRRRRGVSQTSRGWCASSPSSRFSGWSRLLDTRQGSRQASRSSNVIDEQLVSSLASQHVMSWQDKFSLHQNWKWPPR